MEDAIRTFLNEFEIETMEKILLWSKSQNYHIRRLTSEGTRPKLPWAKKIKLDYKKGIIILDNLYNDKTRYVTRSVANHLNDISKINPDFVIETLKKWENNANNKKEFEYIKKHALR
jgi:3-methyladenine DNA glycosylase AlkC